MFMTRTNGEELIEYLIPSYAEMKALVILH